MLAYAQYTVKLQSPAPIPPKPVATVQPPALPAPIEMQLPPSQAAKGDAKLSEMYQEGLQAIATTRQQVLDGEDTNGWTSADGQALFIFQNKQYGYADKQQTYQYWSDDLYKKMYANQQLAKRLWH